jgi:hypothetical protein
MLSQGRCQSLRRQYFLFISFKKMQYAGRKKDFLFQVPLKPTFLQKRAGPGGSHPIMNEWGGHGQFPAR